MKPFSQKAIDLPRSGIRVLLDLAQERTDAIHLEIGQPCFSTPTYVIEAARQAALAGFTSYTPNSGYYSLRERLATQVERLTGVPTSPENVIVTTGSMQALNASMNALLEPGEEVLIPDPGYPNYSMLAISLGAVIRQYALLSENQFRPDFEALRSQVNPKTKVLILNSPSNPTGSVLPPEDVADLVSFAQENDLFIISDEAYDRIIYEGKHTSPRSFDAQRVVSCYSFSKTYAMAGWRIGYAVAPLELARVITKLMEIQVACAPSISQKAAEAALDGPQQIIEEMVDFYRLNRDMAMKIVEEAGERAFRPQGTFYLLIDIAKTGMKSFDFACRLLEETGVVVAPGETFGPRANHYVRISFSTSKENLEVGLKRLMEFLHMHSEINSVA